MCSGMGGLDAPALVHRDVNYHGAVRHVLEHVSCHQRGSGSAGHEHSAHDQIRAGNRVMNHVSTGGESGNLRKKNIVKLAQAIEIVVDDRDVSAHAHRDLRGVCSYYATADNYNSRSRNARHATKQNAATAGHLLEIV